MSNKEADQLANFASELKHIKKTLKAVSSRYDEEEPRITDDPDVWEEQITIDHTINPKFRRRQFAEAWNEVKSQAINLLMYDFGEWACHLIDQVGQDRFPPDIPNPPTIQRQGYFDPATAIFALAATNDTLVAGLRVIFWCAASLRPKSFHRSKGFPTVVAQWVSDLVEFGGGYCVIYSEPLDWAMVALKHLAEVSARSNAHARLHSQVESGMPEVKENPTQTAETTANDLLLGYDSQRQDFLATKTEIRPDPPKPQSSEVEPPSDGPFPPDGFRVGGVDAHVGRPKVWKLIQYLWDQPDRTASFDDLAEPVWGDQEYDTDNNKLGSLRRDANHFFARNGWAFRVQLKNGYASLVGFPN